MTYSDVTWSNSSGQNNGFTISGNAVTPTHTIAGWDNHIRSEDEWSATENPQLKFSVSDADSLNCGLAYDPLTGSTTYGAIEYGVQIDDVGTARAYASGFNRDIIKTNCSGSDVFEVLVTSTSVKWKVNNVEEHSMSTTFSSNTVFYVQTTVKSVGTTVTAEAQPIGSAPTNFAIAVKFYPTNNLRDEVTSGGGSSSSATWRWWVGMRYGTRKRYGTNHIRRMRL